MFAANPALEDHLACDEEGDGKADVIVPVVTLDQLGDVIGGETHE